jgi:inner membrane protein
MASLGHIVVGMAAARVQSDDADGRRPAMAAMLFWAALSFLPDADVIGFGLGVSYGDPWGHRGATHSLTFSLALGAAIGLLAPRFGRPALRTGIMAALVVASHAVLDTLTDGGLGCALFWPFDLTRYFAPWTPLPVSPIGLGYLSPYGLYVATVEIAVFAPVLLYALAAKSTRQTVRTRPIAVGLGVAAWLISLWLLVGGGAVRDRLIRAALRDDTQFAARFSETALDGVSMGDTEEHVRARLGEPFRELGPAGRGCWLYSRSPSSGYFRARAVCFADGRVSQVVRRWFRE